MKILEWSKDNNFVRKVIQSNIFHLNTRICTRNPVGVGESRFDRPEHMAGNWRKTGDVFIIRRNLTGCNWS